LMGRMSAGVVVKNARVVGIGWNVTGKQRHGIQWFNMVAVH